jgi:hypothetical protein
MTDEKDQRNEQETSKKDELSEKDLDQASGGAHTPADHHKVFEQERR